VPLFYREAGDPGRPTLLLHGFPTSSHMFRNLIPLLTDRVHLVAPGLSGCRFTEAPGRGEFAYSFDDLAKVVGDFTDTIGLDR
jgi:pimeloyl-ACP methyl ester carboxylesterase